MKRNLNKFLTDMIQRANPFLVIDEEGKLKYYTSTKEAYKDCILSIFSEFPLGFVDVGMYMMKYQRLTSVQVSIYLGMKQYCFLKYSLLTNFPDIFRDRLKALLLVLLKPSGSKFDVAAFENAMFDREVIERMADLEVNFKETFFVL